MPEGPEVRRVADWLRDQMIGNTIVSFGWSDRSRYHNQNRQKSKPQWYHNCAAFCSNLPIRVVNIWSHGKHILFQLHNESNGSDIFINNHLNMSGKWSYQPNDYSNFWFNMETPDQVIAIFFEDSRTLGYIDFYVNQEEFYHVIHDKVGPDLLHAAINEHDLSDIWFREFQLNRRRMNMKLYKFLHDQRHFSGIGNYLRAEIMYEARINPFRTLGSLTYQEIRTLYDVTLSIIHQSYKCHGLTISTYQDPAGYPGTYDVKIYQKTTDPYGNTVEKHKEKGNQTIHWVPEIQK